MITVNPKGEQSFAFRAVADNIVIGHVCPDTVRVSPTTGHEIRIETGQHAAIIEIFGTDEDGRRILLRKFRLVEDDNEVREVRA